MRVDDLAKENENLREILDDAPSKPTINVGLQHARYKSVDSRAQISQIGNGSSKRPSPPRELSEREAQLVQMLTNPRRRTNRYCPCCNNQDGEDHHHS